MTSRDYIKVEQVRTWLLSSSLAEFQQFYSEWLFQFRFSLLFLFLHAWVHVQFLPFGFCGSFVLFSIRWMDVFLFFGLIISKCSPLKLVFSGGPSFFVRSLCNHGALKLRLHVVALSSSLAMAWSAEFTKGWTGQVRIWLLTSSLTEFKQFYSECFFQFCFS